MIGRTISHYTILEKLGEGGMGIVYKARDLTLDRIVALKFLPPNIAQDEVEESRLLQEARAASGLNHPGICTIHAIGEHDGTHFIDLEFIDGRTLGAVIGQGLLPVGQAVEYAIQACEALQEAHVNGIVHRDIKSDNLMLTSRDRIKVMDFGLARLKGQTRLTKPQSTVGTLAYMAPEQVQGGEADSRSDIFSFGVVLYEMLAGATPFRGDHEAAVVYSIAHGTPEPLSRARPEVPLELERIVNRALMKDPTARYQDARDMAADLRRIGSSQPQAHSGVLSKAAYAHPETPARPPSGGSSPDSGGVHPPGPGRSGVRSGMRRVVPVALGVLLIIAAWAVYRGGPWGAKGDSGGRKMLAVLPFDNLGTPDRDYFADGITEEITSKLSGLSGLGVIARTSAMQYKKTPKSVRQIGDELGVQFILQGTVRWEDSGGESRVRVTPQLINVADGTQVWSQSSEAVLAGVFTIQSEIASKVADALNVTLLQPERQRLESKLTDNPDAYDSFLRGTEYQSRSNNERDLLVAEEMFEKAVALDPKFAFAYASLAGVHSAIYWEYYDHTEGRVRKVKENAEKAIALDPSLPEAHAAMGFYYYHCLRDYENARIEFERGLAVQPANQDLLIGLGSVDRRMGRWDDAIANIGRSVQSDPRSALLRIELAETLIRVRRYSEAEQQLERGLDLAPQLGDVYYKRAEIALLDAGGAEKARAIFDDARTRKIDESDSRYVYFGVLADECAGMYERALVRLSALASPLFSSQEQYIPKDLFLARLYGLMRRPGEARVHYTAALTQLERDVRSHPEDPRIHSALGITYAGLGRKEEAIREGKTATGLLPVSSDALMGPLFVRDLAEVYTRVGETRLAVEHIQYLLSIPSETSVAFLRIDPTWQPLREDPGFQKLVANDTGPADIQARPLSH